MGNLHTIHRVLFIYNVLISEPIYRTNLEIAFLTRHHSEKFFYILHRILEKKLGKYCSIPSNASPLR
jgi:hypothetical protein